MLGIHGGLLGLIEGDVHELRWGDVDGWTGMGAELGISRRTPTVRDFYGIGRGLEQHQIDGLLIIGGWDAFEAAHTLRRERERHRLPGPADPAAGHDRQQHPRHRVGKGATAR